MKEDFNNKKKTKKLLPLLFNLLFWEELQKKIESKEEIIINVNGKEGKGMSEVS